MERLVRLSIVFLRLLPIGCCIRCGFYIGTGSKVATNLEADLDVKIIKEIRVKIDNLTDNNDYDLDLGCLFYVTERCF